MLKKLYIFGNGYVKICLCGDSVGRFFNLCTHNGIYLWNIRMVSEAEYSCFVLGKDVWRLHSFLRKTHTHIQILKKIGIPFFLFRYRKRIIFPITFVCVAFLFGYCSRFIWKIEIEGNSYLTQENLIAYLEDKHAAFGTAKSEIDCDEIELSLREDFSQIIWASVSIEGTNLIVVIQEKADISTAEDAGVNDEKAKKSENDVETISQIEEDKSYAIVANKDAVIESIVTRTGSPQVKAGDSVKAGDVLVVGHQEIINDDGEIGMIYDDCADADIVGRVIYDYKDDFPVEHTVTQYGKGKITGIYLTLAQKRWKIPLAPKSKKTCERMEEYRQAHITEDFYLPMGIGILREFTVEETVEQLQKDQALELAEENFSYFLENLEENGVSIMDKNVMMKKCGQNYQVYGTITGLENIGVLEPESDHMELNMEGTNSDEHE